MATQLRFVCVPESCGHRVGIKGVGKAAHTPPRLPSVEGGMAGPGIGPQGGWVTTLSMLGARRITVCYFTFRTEEGD